MNIFRGRAKSLDPHEVRRLAVNFRSREELLDALNAAFAPELGERFSPLQAGRKELLDRQARGAAAVRLESAVRAPAGRAAGHGHAGLGRARAAARPRPGRRPAVAARGGAPDRRPPADRARRRPPRRRHGRARPRDVEPAAARGGAGGAGPADLRRRRPRLLEPGAGARRPRLAAGAREPARRGGAADRPVLALPRRGHRRARPAGPGRARARQPLGGGAGERTPRSRGCWPPSASTPSARRWRSCSSARSSPPATTSRRCRGPAATVASRTCAS